MLDINQSKVKAENQLLKAATWETFEILSFFHCKGNACLRKTSRRQ